jgi:hypothetical protein
MAKRPVRRNERYLAFLSRKLKAFLGLAGQWGELSPPPLIAASRLGLRGESVADFTSQSEIRGSGYST